MGDWSNEFTFTFLELYKNEPILWNPEHVYYKDKKKVHDAWVRISEEVEISIVDLKRKKDSLMASFRGHLRKKKDSMKSNEMNVYKPIWFAYDTMDEFLGPFYDCKPTSNSTKNTMEAEIKPVTFRSPIRRRIINPPQFHEANRQMKKPCTRLINVLNESNAQEDECDLFARLLAKKLRKLPDNEKEEFMCEIDGMFINRMRRINRSSFCHSTSSPNSQSDSALLAMNISDKSEQPSISCQKILKDEKLSFQEDEEERNYSNTDEDEET